MAFRDDRDALLARNDALERQLEDAKRELSEKQRALDEARNPTQAEPENEAGQKEQSEPEPAPRPAPKGPRPKALKQLGRRLAAELISEDPAVVEQAKRDINAAHTKAKDAAARQLASYIAGGGASAEAACRVLAHNDAPRFGGWAWSKLSRVVLRATMKGPLKQLAEKAASKTVLRGPPQSYLKQKQAEKAAGASTKLLWRVLSVFKRSWVIVVFGVPALFGVIGVTAQPSLWLTATLVLAPLAAFCVLVDAYKRRCPTCRRILAGKLLSVVGDNYGGHTLSWSCAFCKGRWST